MRKRFSLKIFTHFQITTYPEEIIFDSETNEENIYPESKEYCLNFREYVYNSDLNAPLFEILNSFENIHKIFIEENFKNDKAKREAFVLDKNKKQLIIAKTKLLHWKNQRKLYPDSETVQRKIKFLDTVISEYDAWFKSNSIDISEIEYVDGKDSVSHIDSETESRNPSKKMRLASFMRKLLKEPKARNFLQSDASYKEKMKFVENKIQKEPLEIIYKKDTLERYIKPDLIINFLPPK